MNDTLQYLAQHGPMLLAGSSLLLAIGTIAVFVQRSPVHRQRIGELTVLAVMVWLVLANVPMPRLSFEDWRPAETDDRTLPVRVQQPTAPEPVGTTDDTAIVVVAADDFVVDEANSEQVSVVPEPDIVAERVESENVGTRPVESVAVAALPMPIAPIPYGNWRAAVFLTGAGASVCWLLLGRVLLWRMLRAAGRPDEWLLELYESLPCGRRPTLLISQRASRAFSFGLVRPVIVLPSGCCRADNVEQLRAVLLHELAHTEQGDAWGRLLFNGAFPLLWFHPLYWIIRRRTFMAAELIADDRAAAQTSRASYTQELIALVRTTGRARLGHLGAMPVFESRTRFSRRMEMLMRRENCLPYCCTPLRRVAYAICFVLVMVVSGGLLGVTPTQAQTGDDTAEESTAIEDDVRAAADELAKSKEVASEDEDEAKKDAPPNEKASPLQQAVQRGAAYLRTAQRADGTWPGRINRQRVGTTALCTLALLKTGAKTNDAHIQKSLSSLRKAEPKMTYEIALQTLVLCAAEPKTDLALIQRNVELLEASQLAAGAQQGGWTYSGQILGNTGDNSNSGFAIWALDEAAHAGAKVKPQTWAHALAHWRKGQRENGSWDYTVGHHQKGTGSMTCTGIASLAVCLNRKPAEEVTKEEIEALGRGIVWLTDNFAVDGNPDSNAWRLYYLMKLRRVGELTGVRRIGDHKWYSELAVALQETQNPRDGSWDGTQNDREVNTALALLALQGGPPAQLAAEANRTWGFAGRVVDELNEPIKDDTISVRWALGGQPQQSLARTDQRGHFALVYPPKYVEVDLIAATFDKSFIAKAKIIARRPYVLQVPRYRYRIQGIWKVVAWEQAGKKNTEEFNTRQLFVSHDRISVWDGDNKVSEESYQIDPAVKPQRIDLTANDKRAPGIFRMQQGNRLTLCLDRASHVRPSKFEIVSPDEYLIELERYDSSKEIERIEGIDAPANARIATALRERTELGFPDIPLSVGLDFISKFHGIDIDLDQARLKTAGVDLTTTVRLNVEGVQLHVGLEMLLKPLKLRYALRDGQLVVTRRDEAIGASSKTESVESQLRKLQTLESKPSGLRRAADGYERLYVKHRSQISGLQARFCQGRCLQKLGEIEKAATIFDELLKLPSRTEAVRTLQAQVREQLTRNRAASGKPTTGAPYAGSKPASQAVPAGRAGKPLDLIELATAYIDAVGAMELAQLRMNGLDKLAVKNAVSQLEADTARLKLKTAERKVTLFKAIVEQEVQTTQAELSAAKNQLKYERRLIEKGFATRAPSELRIRQLEGRLKTLVLILK